MIVLLWILFIIAIFLEGTVTTLPLTLLFLLCFILKRREESVLFIAFLSGLLLDYLLLRPLGVTSIFFLCILSTAILYERKYETNSVPFVIFSSFFSAILYLWIFHTQYIFLQALVSVFIALAIFHLSRALTSTVVSKRLSKH